MVDEKFITVEIAYALPEQQLVITIQIPQQSTIESAIQTSGILQRFPEIDLTQNKVGIFGRLAKLETRLRPMDRIEIYRSLIADPKIARRNRAEKSKALKTKSQQEK